MPEGTIDDILLNPDYNVNSFMDFIKSAGLTQVFNRTTGNRYTMFVPTNQALASMDQGFLTQIKNNRINSRRKLKLKVNLWCLNQKGKKKNPKTQNKTKLTFLNFKSQFRTYSFRLLFFSIECGLPNIFLK